jgi:glycine oxidase
MLAGSVEFGGSAMESVMRAARERFPVLVRDLAEETGVRVALNRSGVLEIAASEHLAEQMRGEERGEWIGRVALRRLEPALLAPHGARFHPGDGAVDNISLGHALRLSVARRRSVRVRSGHVVRLDRSGTLLLVSTEAGEQYASGHVVIALGAWSGLLASLPRVLPVEPVRGQLVTLGAQPVRHVCIGANLYLVPRPGGQTLLGSTMERTGFHIGTTAAAIDALRDAAAELCTEFVGAPERARWSGLRPVTPDLLPVIGPDPEDPRVLYACGHSRNGVLLAPLTGALIASCVAGGAPAGELSAFAISRFRTH